MRPVSQADRMVLNISITTPNAAVFIVWLSSVECNNYCRAKKEKLQRPKRGEVLTERVERVIAAGRFRASWKRAPSQTSSARRHEVE